MAFLAPIAGGTIGNIALAVLGIGIQLAAAYFFPQKVKGPRAESTKAETSKYGDNIARVEGTARVAGATIWLKGNHVDEHKQTETQGKGGGTTTVNFTYTADFAVAFAWNGPAKGISRIWFDDKIGYDRSADTIRDIISGNSSKGSGAAKGATIKIYIGSDDQLPDPDIETDIGIGKVPAWPGLVYIVVKNFPLDEFGIRIPNVEAEVVMAGDDATPSLVIQDAFSAFDTYGNTYASAQGGLNANISIHSVPAYSLLYTGEIPWSTEGAIKGAGPWVTKMGDVVVAEFTNFIPFYLIAYDANGAGVIDTVSFSLSGAAGFGTFSDIVILGVDHLFLLMGKYLVHFSNDGNGWEGVSRIDVSSVFNHLNNLGGPFSVGPDLAYAIRTSDSNIYTIDWGSEVPSVTHVTPPGLTGTPVGIYYIESVDSVVVLTQTGLFVYTPELDTLLASRTGDFSLVAYASGHHYRIQSGDNNVAIRKDSASGSGNNDVWEYQISDLSVIQHIAFTSTDWDDPGTGGFTAINAQNRVVNTSGALALFLPLIDRGSILLSTAIGHECGYVDLPYDVSLITGSIKGYAVRDDTSPRGVIEDLARVKFFDFTQVNGTTKFFMRSSVTSRSLVIPNDLGFSEGSTPDPKFVQEIYADSKEAPYRVVLDYQAWDADYRMGSQSVSAPKGQNEGSVPFQFSTILIMDDDEAAQTADIFFNELLDAATKYSSAVGPKFLELHPGDVVSLDLDEERREMGTVITKMEGDLLIKLDFNMRTTIYESDAVGVPTPNNPQSLLGISRIAPILIDGHLMRSVDDGNQFYVGVYLAEGGRFNSGTIYKSNDLGSSYAPWLGFNTASLRGIAQNALPDVAHPEAWDYANTLIFHIASKKGIPNLPSSVTDDQLLADTELNAFAVKSGDEWEYIQAAEVTGNTDGTWTLSRLLRGRKGTDFATSGHLSGDPVVYLDSNAIDRPPDGEKDLARMYAAIATSTVFTDQYAVTFTNHSRGLRPWSPWDVRGERDGSDNLTITWERRDRLGQEWPEDGPEDPPMSESVEDYDVHIYDISGGIVRTISVSSETASYSAADQTIDFGSVQSSLMVGVVQNSTTFGAGIETLATL